MGLNAKTALSSYSVRTVSLLLLLATGIGEIVRPAGVFGATNGSDLHTAKIALVGSALVSAILAVAAPYDPRALVASLILLLPESALALTTLLTRSVTLPRITVALLGAVVLLLHTRWSVRRYALHSLR